MQGWERNVGSREYCLILSLGEFDGDVCRKVDRKIDIKGLLVLSTGFEATVFRNSFLMDVSYSVTLSHF